MSFSVAGVTFQLSFSRDVGQWTFNGLKPNNWRVLELDFQRSLPAMFQSTAASTSLLASRLSQMTDSSTARRMRVRSRGRAGCELCWYPPLHTIFFRGEILEETRRQVSLPLSPRENQTATRFERLSRKSNPFWMVLCAHFPFGFHQTAK